jgi:hypothetical protein
MFLNTTQILLNIGGVEGANAVSQEISDVTQ